MLGRQKNKAHLSHRLEGTPLPVGSIFDLGCSHDNRRAVAKENHFMRSGFSLLLIMQVDKLRPQDGR